MLYIINKIGVRGRYEKYTSNLLGAPDTLISCLTSQTHCPALQKVKLVETYNVDIITKKISRTSIKTPFYQSRSYHRNLRSRERKHLVAEKISCH